MPERNAPVLDFLRSRPSRPSKLLRTPVPGRDEVTELLTMASRSPDHKKLVPWRFVVLDRDACTTLGEAVHARALDLGRSEARANMAAGQFLKAYLVVVVVESPVENEDVPAFEQTLAVGGVCAALLNAALASGWGANWLTGWVSQDPNITGPVLGLEAHERVAAFMHIGSYDEAPPDRPRPEMDEITTWGTAS